MKARIEVRGEAVKGVAVMRIRSLHGCLTALFRISNTYSSLISIVRHALAHTYQTTHSSLLLVDHVMGLPVLLIYLIGNSNGGTPTSSERVSSNSSFYFSRKLTFAQAPIEIFGPPGLRNLLRTILILTSTASMNDTDVKFRVHELVKPTDPITSCEPDLLHASELPGRDILCDQDGLWTGFLEKVGVFDVSAGPVVHRGEINTSPSSTFITNIILPAFCLGYVFTELPPQIHPSAPPSTRPFTPRKIVYLGDTSDPSALTPLALSPSLLIHEATFAHISKSISPSSAKKGSTTETMQALAILKGHSTPEMAGAWAKSIGAKGLVLNHFSAR